MPRYNGGHDQLRLTIWYPADPGAKEEPVVSGEPDQPVFVYGRVPANVDC